ncbi:MAG: type IV secretory system conjugative DNA transfer family protein [Rickettsiales bacterium]|jgi:type IV secretion system protein VirD4|nr:type IV secretory system conjugative DNA transfer family protein [Rickettsiales bacterium]
MASFKLFSFTGKGKGLGVFRSSTYKPHEVEPMAQLFWKMRWNGIVFLLCYLGFGAGLIAEHIWRYGWSPASSVWLKLFGQNALSSWGLSILCEVPAWVERVFLRTDMMVAAPIVPLIIYYMLRNDALEKELNPYGKDAFDEESSRKASEDDVKKMGLFKGFMIVLGYMKKKPLMMPETLSALCVAPPGTGKTTAVVVPTLFECAEKTSMIINDPKPELKEIASGWCASKGFVFIMNWAGQDDPANNVYYPSWNPLSPAHVPFQTEKRDLYIDSMCNTLIPDKSSSTADPHWTISGRAALSGLVQFIVSKIDRAKADDYFISRLNSGAFDNDDAAVLTEYYQQMNDPNANAAESLLRSNQLNAQNFVHIGTWANIPPSWYGHEASLSMILDWLNANQIRISEETELKRKNGDQMVMMADPMRDLFTDAVEEARQFGYAHRAILELTQLANTPDKERGSILSTVMAGLGIFRNAAVRNRTSHSDFHFSDLRGIKDPKDGKFKPVHVFLSINLVDADAVNPITAIFIELMSQYLLANKPEDIAPGVGKLGPYPVLFVMDEFPKMQRLQAVMQGPDLGRGCKVSYLLIGQDLHQISEKYGNDARNTIMSTTAAKIVLRQNDVDTAETFSKMMGEEWKIKNADDRTKDEKKRLFSEMAIRNLDPKKQLIIYQGWARRPIEADLQMWFNTDSLKSRKLPEAAPLPAHLVPGHITAMGYDEEKIREAQRK